jgi:chromosome segregation ATPase
MLTSLIVLGLLIVLTGCEGGAKKDAELVAAKAALEQTKQELADVSQSRDRLQGQVKELIKSRDAAVTEAKSAGLRIDELTKKFEEQAKIIRELQEHMQKMQTAIEKL